MKICREWAPPPPVPYTTVPGHYVNKITDSGLSVEDIKPDLLPWHPAYAARVKAEAEARAKLEEAKREQRAREERLQAEARAMALAMQEAAEAAEAVRVARLADEALLNEKRAVAERLLREENEKRAVAERLLREENARVAGTAQALPNKPNNQAHSACAGAPYISYDPAYFKLTVLAPPVAANRRDEKQERKDASPASVLPSALLLVVTAVAAGAYVTYKDSTVV
jgi:hypothetical protein